MGKEIYSAGLARKSDGGLVRICACLICLPFLQEEKEEEEEGGGSDHSSECLEV